MAEKLSDNVGKKIVEALKMQNQPLDSEPIDIEEEAVEEEVGNSAEEEVIEHDEVDSADNSETEYKTEDEDAETIQPDEVPNIDVASILNGNNSINDLDTIFQNTLNQNLSTPAFNDLSSDIEYPNNVAILAHLITKLPAGVSKQTGALIIRQTMEALGIPMKAVVGEAKQVQQTLTAKARECQKNIIDYRKQIATLEIKGQQFQKQAVAMSDMINLFINTGV